MIDHEYGSLVDGWPCSRLVLIIEDESPIQVATETGELVWVTDDRSVYERCNQLKEDHTR